MATTLSSRATSTLPASFAVLLPVAVVAGAALAIANARADAERDVAAGVDSVAVRLGLPRSWAINAGLLALVAGVAIATMIAGGAPPPALAGATGACLLIGAGVAIGHGSDSARRERAWEIEAVGIGLLAAAWLAGAPIGG
jgi:4-hydroxybenzoate polyprenyltransferase